MVITVGGVLLATIGQKPEMYLHIVLHQTAPTTKHHPIQMEIVTKLRNHVLGLQPWEVLSLFLQEVAFHFALGNK